MVPTPADSTTPGGPDRRERALEFELRLVERRDLPKLFEFENDPDSNDMAGTKPRTRAAFFAAWERNFVNPDVHARVIELEDARGDGEREVVGTIARFPSDGHDHIGYWISRAHWGRGLASRALRAFLELETRRPLHATTASTNVRSRRILEKCGFVFLCARTDQESERLRRRESAEFVLE